MNGLLPPINSVPQRQFVQIRRTIDFRSTFGHLEQLSPVGRSTSLPTLPPPVGPPQAGPDADRILVPHTFCATLGPPRERNLQLGRKRSFHDNSPHRRKAWLPACGRYAQ